MVLTFGYFNADNNWWWAVDNIEVSGLPREKIPLFSEDFEGLPLGPNKDESMPGAAVWTKTAPQGWTIDDSGVPFKGDPANGVDEWEGWTFADKDWWALAAEDQRRSEFKLAVGAVAVADSDEYDDKGDPAGTYSTYLKTPAINVAGMEAGTLESAVRFELARRMTRRRPSPPPMTAAPPSRSCDGSRIPAAHCITTTTPMKPSLLHCGTPPGPRLWS